MAQPFYLLGSGNDSGGSGRTGSPFTGKLKRTDSQLKEMLSTLVHEAGFLVEDNLDLLVDDIPEDERTLFKLDSILTAIGLTGELEVMEILSKHEELGKSKESESITGLRESIMKVIRNHIDHQRVGFSNHLDQQEGATDRSSVKRRLGSNGKSISRGTLSYPTKLREAFDLPSKDSREKSEWEELQELVDQFNSKDRLFLEKTLKKYQQALVRRSEMLERNQKLRLQNEELSMLLRRSVS